MCGFKGLVKNRPPAESSTLARFSYLGEDEGSVFHYRCPSCGEQSAYSLAEIRGKFYRTKQMLLYALLVFGMAMMVFRFVHDLFLRH